MFKVVGEGDYLMGGANENEHGQRIYFPVEKRFPNMPVAGPDRRFMSMITYLGGKFNICAAKWYGSNIANSQRGLPRSVLVVVLNDVETGEPLAFMSANLLSAMRTGAIPAVGAKYLASKNATTVAVIGAGVISRATITCMKAALPQLTKAVVYDLYKDKAVAFCNQMSQELGFEFVAADSMEEAVRAADVISIAAAGSTPPVIREEWLKPNVLIASQGKLSLSDELFCSSRVVFDEIKMHKAWKEEEDHNPDNQLVKRIGFPGPDVFRLCAEGKLNEGGISSLSEITFGKTPGRTKENERFIMIIGGMPVEDAAWGWALYHNALKQGIGKELTLWDSPHWF